MQISKRIAIALAVIASTVLVYAAASYPTSVVTFPTRSNGQTIDASFFNILQDEIIAIEGGLLNGLAHDLKFTDGLFDIGKSGATRPRDLFLSRNAVVGGTLGVTGVATFTGATTVGDLRGTAETITATGTVNDQAVGATTTILRFNNASALTINGLTGGADGRVLILESIGAGQVNLAHLNGSATATNRLSNFATSGTTPLAAGVGRAVYVYKASTGYWCLVQHEQGAWITPTFAAGNYTAATGNWTLAAGDVTTQAYRLSGRTLSVVFSLGSTTVSATPASLSVGNGAWGGFTSAKEVYGSLLLNDNGGGNAQGYALVGGSATAITLNKYSGSWATATDTTFAFVMLTFEVQ